MIIHVISTVGRLGCPIRADCLRDLAANVYRAPLPCPNYLRLQ